MPGLPNSALKPIGFEVVCYTMTESAPTQSPSSICPAIVRRKGSSVCQISTCLFSYSLTSLVTRLGSRDQPGPMSSINTCVCLLAKIFLGCRPHCNLLLPPWASGKSVCGAASQIGGPGFPSAGETDLSIWPFGVPCNSMKIWRCWLLNHCPDCPD